MKIAETDDGQNGDGSKSHAPNGTADGQMSDGSSSNVQNNDDEVHKGDDNAKATGSRDRANDKKVTFSRLEPEGKLIMGCRKASIMSSFDQGDKASFFGSNASAVVDDSIKKRSGDVISIHGNLNGKSRQRFPLINQDAKSDPRSAGSIVKSTFNAKKILETKPVVHNNRKNSTLGTKTQRLRIENEDIIELKLT